MTDDRARLAQLKAEGKSREEAIAIVRRERETALPQETSPANPSAAPVPREVSRETPEPPIDRKRQLGALGRAALSSATFGLDDEIASLPYLLPGGKSFGERATEIRANKAKAREEFPKTSFAGDIAGALIPGAGAAKALGWLGKGAKIASQAPKLNLLSQALKGAKVGAAYGALSGAGNADVDPNAGLSEQMVGVGGNALKGGVIGAELGGIVPVAGRVLERPARAIGGVVDDIAQSVKRTTGNVRGAVGTGQVPPVPFDVNSSVAPTKDQMRTLGMQVFGKFGRPEQDAVRMAARRAAADGTDLETALREVAEMTAGGRPVVAPDLMGNASRRLLAGAEAVSPESGARNFFQTRAQNRPARMADDVLAGTGAPRVNLATRAQEIGAEEQPVIERLYREAGEVRTPVPLDEPARDALMQPATRSAARKAVERAADDPIPANRTLMPTTRERQPMAEIDVIDPTDTRAAVEGAITGQRMKDGRVLFSGNPKFAKEGTDALEIRYKEMLDRIERSAANEMKGTNQWTRFDPNVQAMRSGTARGGAAGRAISQGNTAQRIAKDIEEELVGRYKAMSPEARAGRATNPWKDGGQPVWHTLDDAAEEVVAENAGPGLQRLVPDGPAVTEAVEELDTKTIDAIKKRLDVEITAAEKASDMDRVRQLADIKERLLAPVDKANPVYRDARKLFGETQRRKEAVDVGKKLGELKATPDEIFEETAFRPPLEQEEIRNAGANVQRQKMLDGGVNQALDPNRAVGRDERVRTLFGPEAAEGWGKRIDWERAMRETERAGMGSPTAGRLQDMGEIGETNLPAFRKILGGFRQGLVPGLANTADVALTSPVYNRMLAGVSKDRAGALSSLYTKAEPNDLRAVLQLLRGQGTREANALARKLQATGTLANVGGR